MVREGFRFGRPWTIARKGPNGRPKAMAARESFSMDFNTRLRFRLHPACFAIVLLAQAVAHADDPTVSPGGTANPPTAVSAAQEPAALAVVSDPAQLMSSTWDGMPTDVAGNIRLTSDFQTLAVPAGESEIDTLRRELRDAVGQLNASRQELQQTRLQLLQQPAPNDDNDGGQRLSRLETAFDIFRQQLSKEAPAMRQRHDRPVLRSWTTTPCTRTRGIRPRSATARTAPVSAELVWPSWATSSTFTSYMLEVDFATAGRPSSSTFGPSKKTSLCSAPYVPGSICSRSAWTR